MFRNRRDAGHRLGARLARDGLGAAPAAPVVLALPRGGVPVAYEVARALTAPLDVFVVRKLGAPSQPELGVGAIAEGGTAVVEPSTLRALGIDVADLQPVVLRESEELQRRVHRYRGGRPLPEVAGRTVVLVDDGLATGVSARAALRALRERSPARLVLAVPVAAAETVERLGGEADAVVTLHAAHDFVAVGRWYDDFAQVTDDTVVELLATARADAGVPR